MPLQVQNLNPLKQAPMQQNVVDEQENELRVLVEEMQETLRPHLLIFNGGLNLNYSDSIH